MTPHRSPAAKPVLLVPLIAALAACGSAPSQSATILIPSGSTPGACTGNGLHAQPLLVPVDGRFSSSVLRLPQDGYTDSIFVNAAGDRIYFTHSYLTASDFLGVTSNMSHGLTLAGQTVGLNLDYNSDLYYVAWDGSRWSDPINLGSAVNGSQINSLGNECCAWLNDAETEIIFYRDNFDVPSIGPRGNYRATRPDRNSPWGRPELLPGDYGSGRQSATLYRHDLQETASGDVYLWERNVQANTSTLLYGQSDGAGGWLPPTPVPGLAAAGLASATQPWVSRDELTLLFNARDARQRTVLEKATRQDRCSPWSNLTVVPTQGFDDAGGGSVWGEPSLSAAERFMLFIRFDTSVAGWPAQMMFAPGDLSTGFKGPLQLN